MEELRIPIRVKPGSSRPRVGGRHGDRSLIVAVSAKAVDGAATEAALRAVAEALGMPRRAVVLISGTTSRDKVLGVSSESPDTVRELVRELLDGTGRTPGNVPATGPGAGSSPNE